MGARKTAGRVALWALWGGVVWGAVIGGLVLFETSLIYLPSRYPTGNWDLASWQQRTGCRFEDQWMTTADGVRLHGWLVRALEGGQTSDTRRPILLYLHGNAGNISHRAPVGAALARRGMEVLLLDYRGYGRSTGRPSEQGLYEDARTAWRHLASERAVVPGQIVLYGKSLGGAVAAKLASEVQPAGLVLQSTFTSIPDLAAQHYPLVPRFLVRTQMPTERILGQVGCPVFIIHSRSDEIAPFAHALRLQAAAQAGTQLFVVENAGHNDTFSAGGEKLLAALEQFVTTCVHPPRGGAAALP